MNYWRHKNIFEFLYLFYSSIITLGLTSSSLKFFLSEIMTSFQTTSTPSSVSMAKYAASIPGTLRWFTYSRSEQIIAYEILYFNSEMKYKTQKHLIWKKVNTPIRKT